VILPGSHDIIRTVRDAARARGPDSGPRMVDGRSRAASKSKSHEHAALLLTHE